MSDQGETVLVLRDDIVWREAEDAVVVLDTRSSVYISIGGTGPLLWPLLVEGTTMPALASKLVDTFAIEQPVAIRDVGAFIASLRANDLLNA